LTSLKLKRATITSAAAIPKGPYLPAGLPPDAAQYAKVQIPAHCRVAAVLTPTSDSHIEIELWMPARESWNRKYQALGGGRWVGNLNLSGMLNALQQGYAPSSTDTGHKCPETAFAVGHSERLVDFAYRAVHEMTAKSKAIMAAFYGLRPRSSYWNGCSTGGRQGIMEAVRYPEDFDGIIAGAPANNQFQLGAWRINLDTTIRKDPLPAIELLVILVACDYLRLFAMASDLQHALDERVLSVVAYRASANRVEGPDAKIIVMLRNPTDRAFSQYLQRPRE
jgi:feruloyl esterase